MPPARLSSLVPVLAVLLLVTLSGPARASGEAATRHAIWRDCLARNFQIQSVLSTRDLAADAAFQACRVPENAYLAALSGSPLLDDDDVARARPLLAARTRVWLTGDRG